MKKSIGRKKSMTAPLLCWDIYIDYVSTFNRKHSNEKQRTSITTSETDNESNL